MWGTELAGCVEEAVASVRGWLLTRRSPCCSREMEAGNGEKARHLACVLLGCLLSAVLVTLVY